MFILSKLVWAALNPASLISVFGAIGLPAAVLGYRKLGFALLAVAGGILLFFGFSPASTWLRSSLEGRVPPASLEEIAGASGIIVLGGGISGLSPEKIPYLNAFGGRMIESARLAQLFPSLPVIFSGGSGALFPRTDVVPEAQAALIFFKRAGLDADRVRLEDRSRNTFENALFTAKLLRPAPAQKWVLVTSAFHMPRAKALFEAQGFNILPWPTDHHAQFSPGCWEPFPLVKEKLCAASAALKEWAGIATYWLTGDIAHL